MWKKVPWPYEPSVQTEIWKKRFSNLVVYVRNKPHFPYTVSVPRFPDSEWAYSGSMPSYITHIEQAKNLLDEFIPKYLQTGNPNIEKR